MIDRQKNRIFFICDECLEVLETGETVFMSAFHKMREEGWSSYKEDGEWKHSCPECAR